MRGKAIFGLALLCMLGATAQAADYKTKNGMHVTASGDGSFVVSGMTEIWARDYWCAAASYGKRVLGLPDTARLYVIDPHERGDRSIGFTTNADATTPRPTFILAQSLRRAGSDLSIGHAIGFCADRYLLIPI